MKLIYLCLSLMISVCLLVPSAHAQDVVLKEFWGKAPIGTMTMAAAYGTIQNLSDQDIAITDVSSDMIGNIEIHTHVHDAAGVMRMRPMEKLIVPARSEVTLKPGGDHFMLFEVSDSWKIDETGHFSLITEAGETLSTDVVIVEATDFNPFKH